MARIIIRKSRGGSSGPGSINGGLDGGPGSDGGRSSIPVGTIAGEPDPDDFGPTGDDNPSGGRVNGNGTDFVDPTSATRDSGGTGTKRRGRKPGSKNRVTRANPTETSKTLETILFSLHMGMATFFRSEVFAITPEESGRLAGAITRVTELYDIPLLSEKQQAWLNLGIIGASIYGPRVVSVVNANKKKGGPRVVTMPTPVESGGVEPQKVV